MVSTGMAWTGSCYGYTTMGQIKSYEEKDYHITFTCENAKVRLSFLKPDMIRIHMTPDDEFPKDDMHLDENGPYAVVKYDWSPGCAHELIDEGDNYKITAGEIVVKVNKAPFRLEFYDKAGKLLTKEKSGSRDGLVYDVDGIVSETMHLSEDEHFFGLGGHRLESKGTASYNFPDNFDKKGVEMEMFSCELGERDKGGGFPVPFFHSTRGYGIYFNNFR